MAEKPVVAVLGVGPGLGAALAHRFAKEYAVAINARRAEYLKSLAEEIRAEGGQVCEAPGRPERPSPDRDAVQDDP